MLLTKKKKKKISSVHVKANPLRCHPLHSPALHKMLCSPARKAHVKDLQNKVQELQQQNIKLQHKLERIADIDQNIPQKHTPKLTDQDENQQTTESTPQTWMRNLFFAAAIDK